MNNYYESESSWGDYQFVSLQTIIDQFLISYVGENKIIPKVKTAEVSFHAHRAVQELSFDTFKSTKSQELIISPSLQMPLPQDYVNYTKLSWIDGAGLKHILYPISKTSNPKKILQDSDKEFTINSLTAIGDLVSGSGNVTLDAVYKNIVVGMRVTGPYVPVGTFVQDTNHNGTTTITMEDSAGDIVTPVIDGTTTGVTNSDTTLKFEMSSGLEVHNESSIEIIDALAWADPSAGVFDFKITAVTDISSIKKGMLVYSKWFPQGTTVVNVSGSTIVIDQEPTNTSAVTTDEVTFVSQDAVDSTTWSSYKSANRDHVDHHTHSGHDHAHDHTFNNRERYGLDPQRAQANGSFFIDNNKIYFSSNISGKTVILDYISDGIGGGDTTRDFEIHKFAEEAMYKYIAHAILSTTANTPEYMVARFKKERFAEVRKAKLRLSNLKIEELTQILRGKSKQIKH